MKKTFVGLCCIIASVCLMTINYCFAVESKMHMDEFLFVDAYLNCLANYSKADYLDISTQMSFYSTKGNVNYSREDVFNSDSMKQLKKEQEFISSTILIVDKYSDSSIDNVKKAANVILKKYHTKQALNVKAQDAYFYTKTGQFKAGIMTANELYNEEKIVNGDDYWQGVEEGRLIREVLFPGITVMMKSTDPIASIGNSVMKITHEERDLLLKKVMQLKKRFDDTQHLNDWSVKFFLDDIERFLMINFPCLKIT